MRGTETIIEAYGGFIECVHITRLTLEPVKTVQL